MYKQSFTSDMAGTPITVQRVIFSSTRYTDIAQLAYSMPTVLVFVADVTSGDVTIQKGTTFQMCTEVYADDAYHFTGIVHSTSTDGWFAYDASVKPNDSWTLTYKEL